MKRVKAYGCEFCKKLLYSYSGMKAHEDKCFKNPKSKSCLTCKNFNFTGVLNGNKLSPNEVEILKFKTEGTFKMQWDGDPDGIDYPVLNDEFKYLYDAEMQNFCDADSKILTKLKTRCEKWEG